MSQELLWFLVPLGGTLWAAGGTWWKPYRRWIYAIVLGAGLAIFGTPWWSAWLTAIFTSAVAHCGYGDAASWGKRWLIGICYGLSVAPLVIIRSTSMIWAMSVLALSFVLLLWLTRKWNWVPHKLVELSHGFLHSGTAVWIVTH